MSIQPFILARQSQLAELCARVHAKRLDVFGSAVRDDFSDTDSDLDFLVEFDAMPPGAYADAWFELKEGLEGLFHRPVDLLTPAALKNPFFKARVESEREPLYGA